MKKQYKKPTLQVLEIEPEGIMACSREHLGNSGHHPGHNDCHHGHSKPKYRTEFPEY